MFVAFGAAFIYFGRNYHFGSPQRMGPSFMPMLLGVSLVLLGGVLAASGFRASATRLGAFSVKPLSVIVFSIIGYGATLRPLGLVLSTALLVSFVTYVAGAKDVKLALLLGPAVSAIAALIFVIGLGVPINLWPDF
jgi:hypothetical protein